MSLRPLIGLLFQSILPIIRSPVESPGGPISVIILVELVGSVVVIMLGHCRYLSRSIRVLTMSRVEFVPLEIAQNWIWVCNHALQEVPARLVSWPVLLDD